MTKRTALLVGMTLLLTALMFQGAAAQDATEVSVWVWQDGSHSVGPNEDAVIHAGWGACSRGLVRSFTRAIEFEVTLDGSVILTPGDVDQLWGPIEPRPDAVSACKNGKEIVGAEWRFVLPELSPGPHEVRTTIWSKRSFIDGGDYDGDGRPDRFGPFDQETVNTIEVVGGD